MTALATLARMLGVSPRLAEDAMHSERAARVALSRRNLFLSAGAMAAGTVMGLPVPDDDYREAVRLEFERLLREELSRAMNLPPAEPQCFYTQLAMTMPTPLERVSFTMYHV